MRLVTRATTREQLELLLDLYVADFTAYLEARVELLEGNAGRTRRRALRRKMAATHHGWKTYLEALCHPALEGAEPTMEARRRLRLVALEGGEAA